MAATEGCGKEVRHPQETKDAWGAGGTHLELSLAPGVQGPLVEQAQVPGVPVSLALLSGLLGPGKALQQGCLQRADVPMQRLEKGTFRQRWLPLRY